MTCKLSVNVNAVAYLRNRRSVPWPDLEHLGRIALEAGAVGLTVHPRPDERHIRRSDVPLLRVLVDEFPGREYNIEGYPDEAFLKLVEANEPDQVTLVPDAPGQGTSDHGWDCLSQAKLLTPIVARLKARGMRVAIFVDPDPAQPAAAKALGADRIEIYTGPYGDAVKPADVAHEFGKVVATGKAAQAAGIDLNAGHDLTRANLPALVKALPNLREVSIGHGVFADAWEFGLAATVRKFREAIGDL
ncbi:MAG: pyridoxine 5'-phosphate synthase [Alphaproteobacteria bacterium]|nr:pyridoxine 5'-phosphate synthase [Alphaproteobacteria bacterium]